jgi:hypothetical protein
MKIEYRIDPLLETAGVGDADSLDPDHAIDSTFAGLFFASFPILWCPRFHSPRDQACFCSSVHGRLRYLALRGGDLGQDSHEWPNQMKEAD